MRTENLKPIALQSKSYIIESFLDLLSRKPLRTITIAEITVNAKIDRGTFYRHFDTKEEVIGYYTHNLAKKYEEIMERDTVTGRSSLAKAIFEVSDGIKDELQLLHKQNMLHFLLIELNLIFHKYQHLFATQEELQLENGEFILAYHIGGIWNLILKWIADGGTKSPEEMDKLVEQIFSLRQI